MKNNSEYIKFLFIGLLSVIITYSLVIFLPPKISFSVNDLPAWYIYSISQKFVRVPKIVGIEVDDYSVRMVAQRWPWKRALYAQLVELLDREKVNSIGFDFAFVGESENKEDDIVFKEALEKASARVILAYLFDYKKGVPVLPQEIFRKSAYSLGMLNTPQDPDDKIRRLRGTVKIEDASYHSFSLALSAAFLKQDPNLVVSRIPLLKDGTFFVNFLLRPKDIVRVSFYDVVADLAKLKEKHGNDFLKDALVLIYPEAEVLHDLHQTPLGRMPGGFLHLNGAVGIISHHFMRNIELFLIPFGILIFLAIFYILKYTGLLSGAILVLGINFIGFWILVALGLVGLKFNYFWFFSFAVSFFLLGSLYKYISFLAQLLKIKDKVTLDPLTNIFTLRYFYYRLEPEFKKIYLGKDLFLIFLYLEAFKDAAAGLSLQSIKELWQQIRLALAVKGSFWSLYSQEELAGCLAGQSKKILPLVNSLRNNLGALLNERNIKAKVRIGYLKLKREYPIRELLFTLSNELKKRREEEVLLFEGKNLTSLISALYSKTKEEDKLLESIDEDIEEKNRQLLALNEDLEKEHQKTKEAFFQIITSLVNALEARDPYTEGHSERVCGYALKMAERLGWDEKKKDKFKKACLLHDLGKIGIPDSILHKKGGLTDEEYDFIKKHEIIGVKILEPLKEFSEILPWIMYHHERWDGKGYPHGLAGDAIPLPSQIIALADVFDALSTGRDYKNALSSEESLKEIIKNKGTQFNPQLVDLFIETISKKENPPQK